MKKRLTDNFWMKLLSLGLAVMLWLIIKLSANLSYTSVSYTHLRANET